MGAANEAAYVVAPLTGFSVMLTVTVTAKTYAIPQIFAGMPCDVMLEGADGMLVTGGSSVSAPADLVTGSTVSGSTITVGATHGYRLQDGQAKYWIMPAAQTATHFSIVGSATGYLMITKSGAAL